MRCFALPCFGLPYTLYIYTYTHVHMLYMYGESMTFATDLTACHHLTFSPAPRITFNPRARLLEQAPLPELEELRGAMLFWQRQCWWVVSDFHVYWYVHIYINVPSISSTYPISHYQPWALPCKITMFHGGSSMVDHEEGRSQEPDAILFTPKKMDQFFLMVILFIPKIEDHIDSVLIHIRFSTFSGEVSTVSTFSRCCVVVVVVVGRKQASAAKRRGG